MIEDYTERKIVMEYHPAEGLGIAGKHIVKLDRMGAVQGAHEFTPGKNWSRCLADAEPWPTLPDGSFVPRIFYVFEPVLIYHYVTLSFEECMSKLKARAAILPDNWRVLEGDR